MSNSSRHPLSGPAGLLFKFFGAALFGGFLSLLVLVAAYAIDIAAFAESRWVHLLWIIPLIWGLLGLIWFEPMLNLARNIVNAFFHAEE